VMLDDFSRFLVALLDSQHDHSLLTERVQAAIANGDLALPQSGPDVPAVDVEKLDELVDKALTGICGASLLMA